MKLSVIIPCYNAENFIGTQLEAIADQQWSEPWEVIVADNGSTDNSIKIVNEYKSKLPNLRIVDASDKKGAAHARNVGVQAAKGDALVFCDADDEVAPGWLSAMGNALSIYDFVACRIDIEKLNPQWVIKRGKHPQSFEIQQYRYPPFLPHAGGSTLGVKRWVHEMVGGFDESMSLLEDTDYCWRIQTKGIMLHFVEDAVIHVRLKSTLKGIFRQAYNWGQYNVKIYRKYLPHGMPKLSWRQGILSWKALLRGFIRSIPKIRDKGDVAKWVWEFGWRLGRLKGSIKYGVFAL